MPKPPFPDDVREFLAKPNAAVVATVRPDGQPVTVATWYLLEPDGRIQLNMDDARVRLEHMRRDPRVSLTVLDENWGNHVSVIGRITEMTPDTDLTEVDRVSTQYTGGPYPVMRERSRTAAWLTVDRWHGWGRFAT